ncbi:hypothetical protein NDU88_006487 [Pleurodeles waltl]|uniref:Uncharacterized protein n=1 Tax=Pleurodeles waltl TaxID=8319 RepID=A0AAV7NU78_PLEWA|nr:hypothetical protein NDU88_006487 [Pleurodeles waltl]
MAFAGSSSQNNSAKARDSSVSRRTKRGRHLGLLLFHQSCLARMFMDLNCIVYYTRRELKKFCQERRLTLKKKTNKQDLQKSLYAYEESYWIKEAKNQEGDDSWYQSEKEDPFAALQIENAEHWL